MTSEEADSTSDDEGSEASDVNAQVEAEWVEETTPFDRVQAVMRSTYEGQSADKIAERARTTPTLAREQLERLRDVGFVEAVTTERTDTLYRCSAEAVAFHEARRILSEVDPETLDKRIAEMQEDLQIYQERFGAESPEDAATMDADVNREVLREWRTTRRNLGFARVALALGEAAGVIHTEGDDDHYVETATANRKDWTGTTPTDAGESLFGGDSIDK